VHGGSPQRRGRAAPVLAEGERSVHENQAADTFRMESREDRRQGAAEGMSRQDRDGRTCLGLDGCQGGARQTVGIFRKPEPILVTGRDEPFEQVDAKSPFEKAAHHAHGRQEIPDIGALEGSRDDQDHWPLGACSVVIGPQPGSGKFRDEAMRGLVRSQATGAERPAHLPSRLVHPLGHWLGSLMILSIRAPRIRGRQAPQRLDSLPKVAPPEEHEGLARAEPAQVGAVGAMPELQETDMRIVPTRLHGAVDYLWGLALLAAPWLLGFADVPAATWIAVLFGAGAILYSLLTDYELGLVRLLPMRLHLLIDGLGGAFLAASPFLFGFADRVYLPHLLFGLFSVAASLVTRMKPVSSSGSGASVDRRSSPPVGR